MKKHQSEYALELIDLVKNYPGTKAIDQISFKVKAGAIHGFLGPNGAGKSTTMNIIANLFPASSGEVKYFGEKHPVALGFLPENPPLYMNMKVEDYLIFVAEIHGLKKKNIGPRLNEVLQKCGLAHVRGRLIRNLSKGYKQRVGIAQAIVHDPEIIILDEPTVGLDPNAIIEIRELILSLASDHTILLSTHQLHEAQLLCSDITIINRGRIIQSGSFDSLKNNMQAKALLRADVLSWNQELEKKLRTKLPIVDIKSTKLNEKYCLEISFSEDRDFRSDLSQFIVEEKCGLLQLSEEKIDLENVFKKLTNDSDRELSKQGVIQ